MKWGIPQIFWEVDTVSFNSLSVSFGLLSTGTATINGFIERVDMAERIFYEEILLFGFELNEKRATFIFIKKTAQEEFPWKLKDSDLKLTYKHENPLYIENFQF